MSTKPPSKSVFIGNIPYGLTEEQIIDIFSSAGKVLNFRLVYDRETGRPKGFGFAEYPDQDSAASAVRNLDNHEIMNRRLRVDFSNDGTEDDSAPVPQFSQPQQQNGVILPPLPAGTELPPGVGCPDAISRTLSALPPTQLLDVLQQMKTLVASDPAKATELLRQAPQLSYAIFQALLLMGLVSTDALASVVEQATNPVPAPIAAPVLPPQQSHVPIPAPVPYPGGYPAYPPPPQQFGNIATPPVSGMPYQQPNAQTYQPPQPPPVQQPAALGADADALIQQVLAMPQELIDQLPSAERQQIMALKMQYSGVR